MIAHKGIFFRGLGLMVAFAIVFVIFFMPVFNGENGLDYLDNLYNSISKASAYYIPKVAEESRDYAGKKVTVSLQMHSEEEAARTERLFQQAGAEGREPTRFQTC